MKKDDRIPDYVYKSMLDVPLDELHQKGYRAALFDLDNTIAPDHLHEPPPLSFAIIEKLKEHGFLVCMVSNARSNRAGKIASLLHVPAVTYARKPKPDGIFRAIDMLKVTPAQCVFFGDQIFTDIRAANRAGILSVLIEPVDPKEIFYVRLKRPFEKRIRRRFQF